MNCVLGPFWSVPTCVCVAGYTAGWYPHTLPNWQRLGKLIAIDKYFEAVDIVNKNAFLNLLALPQYTAGITAVYLIVRDHENCLHWWQPHERRHIRCCDKGLLIMRYLLLIQMLLLASIAFGQGNIEKVDCNKKKKLDKPKQHPMKTRNPLNNLLSPSR